MKKLGILLTIITMALACSKAQMPEEPTPKVETELDLQFRTAEDSVMYGKPVEIQWQSTGSHVVLDHGIGTRGPVGVEEITFANPGKKIITATAYGAENLLKIKHDSVYVKEAPTPILPVILLSVTRKVTINSEATISWASQNADYIVVDHVSGPAFQGQQKVSFSSPGIRIVTATAFNGAGYVSSTDTIEVVEEKIAAVSDMVVAGEGHVRADKGEDAMIDRDVATFEITTRGRYRLKAEIWYNSGDTQRNESFYIQLSDATGLTLSPQNPNAGVFKVVPDDAGEPHTAARESGIFQLTSGRYSVDLFHYAKIAHIYPQFINDEISGPESVKLLGFRIEYLGD